MLNDRYSIYMHRFEKCKDYGLKRRRIGIHGGIWGDTIGQGFGNGDHVMTDLAKNHSQSF